MGSWTLDRSLYAMKTRFLPILLSFLAAVPGAVAYTVASYDAGVLPAAGVTGAANPTNQGWTPSVTTMGAYNHGMDSSIGGWRITDGTSTANFFYQMTLSPTAAADMANYDWVATWTTALVADAVHLNGLPNGVDNYYSSTPTRQNNNAMWVELAGQFAYVLIHKADASGNVVLSDGVSNFQITTAGNQMAQEIGAGAPGNVNYITYTLSSKGGVVTLSDSLGGNFGPVVSYPGYTPSINRVVWGAFNNAGQARPRGIRFWCKSFPSRPYWGCSGWASLRCF